MKTLSLLCCGGAAVMLLGITHPIAAQSILIDKPVRAAELTVFPDLNDSLSFYYLPDKVRLSVRDDGTPEFSFLRFVQNVHTAADQPEAREGQGGGIVHAVVSLSVTPEQRQDALRDLRRAQPNARIVGPVIYESGKFTLISSFRDPQGGLTKQVVGVGSAPILDGEKAAISIQLTQFGSRVLWESFQTATPDISFSFEMELKGYQSPMHATIEADLDQIYEHQAFAAGVATTYFGAEIKGAFDDLRRKSAIRLIDVGADANLEALITTAYNKLIEVIFQPAAPPTGPEIANGTQTSLLDRATALLKERRDETRADNAAIRDRNAARRKAEGDAAAAQASVTDLGQRSADADRRVHELDSRAQAERQRVTALQGLLAGATGDRAAGLRTLIAGAETAATTAEREAAQAKTDADKVRNQLGTARTDAARTGVAHDSMEKTSDLPGFAAMATYEMKRVHQQGFFRVDLNKYTTVTKSLRFDQNIGDLRQYLGRPEVFREANLEDPLMAQREVVAFLDGFNASDFAQYINFVTVQLRKRHANGVETVDETRVDRNNFSGQGNQFKMLYGWQGDNDRRQWLDFEYRAQWSFFGGSSVDEPWRPATASAVALVPPYQLRHLTLEGQSDDLRTAQVRSITAKLFYPVAGRERVKQVTLTVGRDPLSASLDFIAPADTFSYSYELSWRLTGNRTVTTGRKSSSEAVLYVDELPPH